MDNAATPITDLSALSTEQLRKLQGEIKEQLQARESHERKKAIADIHAIAERLGMSLSELIGGSIKFSKQKGSSTPVPPKYRSKKNPEDAWSGRGRQPQWVKDHIDGGGKIEDLQILP
jgi:DNA-binding protein H-NS